MAQVWPVKAKTDDGQNDGSSAGNNFTPIQVVGSSESY